MSEKSSKFLGKISPLIEGQLPDFIRDENPLFVKFVKDYYKFLEAGKMELTATNDYIKYETETVSYVLNEEGDRILAEQGSGTVGNYINGETITGNTSGATATVLVEDSRNKKLYISSQQKFITNETFTSLTVEFAVMTSPSKNAPVISASSNSVTDAVPSWNVIASLTIAVAPDVCPVIF